MAMHSTYPDSRDDPIVSSPADSAFLEQFRPAPLSWLVAWMFRSRHEQVAEEPDQFEEHINGLA